MSLRRLGGLALRGSVPVLAAGMLAVVLVEPRLAGAAPGQPSAAAGREVPVESTQLVCPGPETVGVRGGDPSAPGAAAQSAVPVQVAAATAPGWLRPVPGGSGSATSGSLGVWSGSPEPVATAGIGRDVSAFVQTVTRTAVSPVVLGTGAAAPGAVAEQTSLAGQGDLRGLSSATCLAPQDDQWLVGGGSDVGRRGRLVLSNPQGSTVEVSVDVLSTKGTVPRTTGSTVALAPRSRTVLLLDALAPVAAAPVLRVRSTGGSIGAVLQDTWLEGTTPRGTDDAVAALPPATRVLVPGVRVAGSASVRIAVPGTAEAVTQVRLFGGQGPVDLPDGGVVRVPAGSSRDLDLSGVPAGAYGVEVTSDVPVVAGAVVQRRSAPDGPGEIAWSASSDAVTSLAGVAGVEGVAGVAGSRTDLVLTAPRTDVQVDVVIQRADGTSTTTAVRVAGGTTKVVPVAGRSAWLRPEPGTGELVAARFVTRESVLGAMVTAGPLRQVTLTAVPTDIAPAAG